MSGQPTLAQGLEERERLRDDRARNYQVKRAAGFICQHEGCSTGIGVVVVETKDGFGTRCVPHLGRLRPVPGQWIDRSPV